MSIQAIIVFLVIRVDDEVPKEDKSMEMGGKGLKLGDVSQLQVAGDQLGVGIKDSQLSYFYFGVHHLSQPTKELSERVRLVEK